MVSIVSPTTVTNYNKNEMHNPIIITAQLIPDASHYSTHGSNKWLSQCGQQGYFKDLQQQQ